MGVIRIMEELQQIKQDTINEAEKNHEPLVVDCCGCIFTDEKAILCQKHFNLFPDWY